MPTRFRQLGVNPRSGSSLRPIGICDLHRRNDERRNYLRLAEVARVVKRYHAPLRVNVYQSVRSDIFALSYQEYWQGLSQLVWTNRRDRDWRTVSSSHGRLAPRAGGCGVSTSGYSARDDSALRLLAGRWGPLAILLSLGSGVLETAPLWRLAPRQSRAVPALIWSLPWRLRGTFAASKSFGSTGFLLPNRPRRRAKSRNRMAPLVSCPKAKALARQS